MITFYFKWLLREQLAMGSRVPSEEIYRDLVDNKGITHILNLEKHCELKFDDPIKKTPRVLHMYFPDDGQKRPEWYWDFGFEFTRRALQNGGTVFVHCRHGQNRGPSMAYGILQYFNSVPEDQVSEVQDFDRDPEEIVFPGKGEPIYQAQIDNQIQEDE